MSSFCSCLLFTDKSLCLKMGLLWWLSWCPGFDPWAGKIPSEKGIATHSSILALRIPRTEEPGGLQSVGSQRAGHSGATFTCVLEDDPSFLLFLSHDLVLECLWLQEC